MTTWIKLNNNIARHPKIAGLSDRSFRTWITGLCYASEFLTDGILPIAFLITVPRRVVDDLLFAGLWLEREGVITIHDYLRHQQSKDQVERERERNRDRRTGGSTGGTPPGTPGGTTSGTHAGRTAKVPRPDKEIRLQSTDPPPNPPLREGPRVRVLREHRKQAEKIWKAYLGYCQHDPKCASGKACCDRLAIEIAQKLRAS